MYNDILLIIVKILITLLTILMYRFFIIDLIHYFKKKRYGIIFIGIMLIGYFIYIEYKVLIL